MIKKLKKLLIGTPAGKPAKVRDKQNAAYKKQGTKVKGGTRVNNCVKVKK